MTDLHVSSLSLFPYPDSSSGPKAKNYHQDKLRPQNKTNIIHIPLTDCFK